MSPTFQHLPAGDEARALKQRVERLKAALEWAGEAIESDVRHELDRTISRCEQRLALGINHTIVALAGGTGSGKSSLFNALVGEDFAVPGVACPTTSAVSSAAWSHSAEALLDWLGVEPHRRLNVADRPREARDERTLTQQAMVLLDLPDHDSVNAANREVVDRVVPMADLLLWVVDPQKYADHALHSAYLQVASGHGQPSMVVLNQIDRLSAHDGFEVATDLQRLIALDGLADVHVIPASTVTGEGIDLLWSEIIKVGHGHTAAAQAVRADLVAAGRALAKALSKRTDPELPPIDEMVSSLARAVGVDARADAAAAVALGRAHEVPELGAVTLAAVERERLDWVDAATDQLPISWRAVVDAAVAPAQVLTAEINAALAEVKWPATGPARGWRAWFRKKAVAASAERAVLAVGREVVRRVVVPGVVEPTQRIHEAYRVLDELTEFR